MSYRAKDVAIFNVIKTCENTLLLVLFFMKESEKLISFKAMVCLENLNRFEETLVKILLVRILMIITDSGSTGASTSVGPFR